MHREHSYKQPYPLGLALTERVQCNHTTRTQHNKRLLTVLNRNLMIQLQRLFHRAFLDAVPTHTTQIERT